MEIHKKKTLLKWFNEMLGVKKTHYSFYYDVKLYKNYPEYPYKLVFFHINKEGKCIYIQDRYGNWNFHNDIFKKYIY